MDECIFCKIAKKEIPCSKVYEDKKILAFMDLAPINKGHVLVIPKEHHKDMTDMPGELLADIAKVTKKIAKAIIKATKADGFNIGQNNGKAAGQEVMHFHLHIIPRFTDDGLISWPGKQYEEGEMDKIAEDIRSLL